MSSGTAPAAPSAPARLRVGGPVLVASALIVLALVETGNALVAPSRAPSDDDWRAAAAIVRKEFRPGDLIVAAPAWADPVVRQHLGDLVPVAVAGRLDDARFGRVWEIGQRGARALEATGTEAHRSHHGALVVRRVERKPAEVTFDFVARWQDARVARREPAREVACALAADRHQCPELGWNFVRPAVLEIGNELRHALYVQPVGGAAMVVEWPAVPLGREIAFAGGLHNVWFRKVGHGQVTMKVFVEGREIAVHTSGNRSGYAHGRADTSAWAGRTAPVRFEITADDAYSRHFGFAAEARTP